MKSVGALTRPGTLIAASIAAYAAGFAALSVLRHEAFFTGRFDLGNMVQAVWSTAHGDPLGDDGTARRADLAPRRARRPDPRSLRAALVALAEPEHAPRRPGGSGRDGRPARLLARTEAPRLVACGNRLRARLPPLSRDRMVDAQRVPPRRARDAVAALRSLVPRRGSAPARSPPSRLRRRHARRRSRSSSPASGSGTGSRIAARSSALPSPPAEGSGRRLRSAS